GQTTIDFNGIDSASGLHVYDDGSILLSGSRGNGSIAIAKLTAEGELDDSFRGGGKFTQTVGSSVAMAVLPQTGKILVAGQSTVGHIRVTRFRPNGDLDTSY